MKGYKTIAFNVIMAVITVLALFNPGAELPTGETVSESLDAVFAAISSVTVVGNMILRAVTNSPVFKKETPNA